MSWKEDIARAATECDALLFATAVLGFAMPGEGDHFAGQPELDPWQVKALATFSKQWRMRYVKAPRLSIKSGHGVGKTCFLSIVILFVMCTAGRDCKIPVVANSQDQLRDGLWPELAKWIGKLPQELREAIEWQKERIVMTHCPEESFAVARTASKHRPEALQGIHATTILAVFEEASGIPEETIEAGAGTLSTPGAGVLCVGNPTRASGFFWATHNKPDMRMIWETMTVNSEDVPRARGHVEDIIALYGKDSNKYRVRVKGEFPTQDDDTVIPLAFVLASKGRNVPMSNVWPIWGVDVARFGDDRSALVKRQGNTITDVPKIWRHLDGNQLAGRINAEYEQTPNDLKPKAICIDAIGVGYACLDALRHPSSPTREIVIGVDVSSETQASDLDNRRRDELWFEGRKWFANRESCIPLSICKNDKDLAVLETLIAELTVATFDHNSNGKRVVEQKKDMKKRLGSSPDLADAFLMTFAVRPEARPDRSGRPWTPDDEGGDDLADAWAA